MRPLPRPSNVLDFETDAHWTRSWWIRLLGIGAMIVWGSALIPYATMFRQGGLASFIGFVISAIISASMLGLFLYIGALGDIIKEARTYIRARVPDEELF